VCHDIVSFTHVRIENIMDSSTDATHILKYYPCSDYFHTVSIKDEYRMSGNVFEYYNCLLDTNDLWDNQTAEYYGYLHDDRRPRGWDEKLLDDIKLCYDNMSSKHVDLMHELKQHCEV